MSTKITVAVGPNGEALNSKALRDGSRADRIETESTTKQAKQFVADEVDKLTQGRDNPDGKYKPSRDPAAFARKKKEQAITPGQFCGLKINFEHFPFFGRWDRKRNVSYMNIRVQGITDKGDTLTQVTKIELKRNLVIETFNALPPPGYVEERAFSGATNPWGFSRWPAMICWRSDALPRYLGNTLTYLGLEDFSKYAIKPGAVRDSDGKFSPADYGDAKYFGDKSPRVMEPMGDSTAYTIYAETLEPKNFQSFPEIPAEGFPPLEKNPNTYINGRTDDDDTTEGYENYHQDPVHELFMLPFTENKFFLLVIFTDYMIQTRSWNKQVSEVQNEFFYSDVVSPRSDPTPVSMNRSYYTRHAPDYNLPEGYEIDGLDGNKPVVDNQCKGKITRAGADKIQTIKLYAVDNGVITEVEEIPEELRQAASNLCTNLEGYRTNAFPYNNYNYSKFRVDTYYRSSGTFYDTDKYDAPGTYSFPYIYPQTSFIDNSTLNSHVQASRKYLGNQARERSMAKGYGFGALSTNNHFRSKYINSLSKGFADDTFFTPAVYDYLRGTGHGPTTVYGDEAGSGLAGDLSVYADHNGPNIRFTTVRPTTISTVHPGPFEPWQEVPALKGATHQCWNWNRPDLCWDQLNALGFGRDLIGSRPARHNE